MHFLEKRYITKRQYLCIAIQKMLKIACIGCILNCTIVIEIESGKDPQMFNTLKT